MTFFRQSDLKAAYLLAERGGQALLECRCREGARSRAWLIDHDYRRLIQTAKRFGSTTHKIYRGNRPGQFVTLTGHAMQRAIAEAQTLELSL